MLVILSKCLAIIDRIIIIHIGYVHISFQFEYSFINSFKNGRMQLSSPADELNANTNLCASNNIREGCCSDHSKDCLHL